MRPKPKPKQRGSEFNPLFLFYRNKAPADIPSIRHSVTAQSILILREKSYEGKCDSKSVETSYFLDAKSIPITGLRTNFCAGFGTGFCAGFSETFLLAAKSSPMQAGVILESEEIEGGRFWKVRRLRQVIFRK